MNDCIPSNCSVYSKRLSENTCSGFLGAFSKLRKARISFVISVCFLCPAPTWWIPMRFEIGDIYEYLSRKSKFCYNRAKISDNVMI